MIGFIEDKFWDPFQMAKFSRPSLCLGGINMMSGLYVAHDRYVHRKLNTNPRTEDADTKISSKELNDNQRFVKMAITKDKYVVTKHLTSINKLIDVYYINNTRKLHCHCHTVRGRVRCLSKVG